MNNQSAIHNPKSAIRRIEYIAHPIGGDVKRNVEKLLAIVQEIHVKEPDVIPFVPYLADVITLHDADKLQRNRGLSNCRHIIRATDIKCIRLYGDEITEGMIMEIQEHIKKGAMVRAMNRKVKKQLEHLVRNHTIVMNIKLHNNGKG